MVYVEVTGNWLAPRHMRPAHIRAREQDPTCQNDRNAHELSQWIETEYPQLDTEIVVEDDVVKRNICSRY